MSEEKANQLREVWLRVPTVNEDCIGCSACVVIAPEVFELDEEGMSVVKERENFEWMDVEDAIDACPVNAISWKD